MFFPIMDYDVRQFQPRNGALQTYTLPYRAIVMIGDFRPDDTGGGSVAIRHFRRVQDSQFVDQYILVNDSATLSGDSSSCGAVVGEAGDVVRVQAVDDFDVKVYIFRLP